MMALLPAFVGGGLIGIASAFLLWMTGQLAGVSGISAGVLRNEGQDRWWRAAFILGLVSAGIVYRLWTHAKLPVQLDVHGVPLILAGLLVGIGTRLGNGCTSGHGVCGIARGSRRSVTATVVFVAVAMVTVYLRRHGFSS